MRFVKLTEPELETLLEGHKDGSQFQFRNRCFSIILSHRGKTVSELLQFFVVSRITSDAWFNNWKMNALTGLMKFHHKPIFNLSD